MLAPLDVLLGRPTVILEGDNPFGNLAASQGDEDAREERDTAASEMTPDQIAEAQRMAREWMAKNPQ